MKLSKIFVTSVVMAALMVYGSFIILSIGISSPELEFILAHKSKL